MKPPTRGPDRPGPVGWPWCVLLVVLAVTWLGDGARGQEPPFRIEDFPFAGDRGFVLTPIGVQESPGQEVERNTSSLLRVRAVRAGRFEPILRIEARGRAIVDPIPGGRQRLRLVPVAPPEREDRVTYELIVYWPIDLSRWEGLVTSVYYEARESPLGVYVHLEIRSALGEQLTYRQYHGGAPIETEVGPYVLRQDTATLYLEARQTGLFVPVPLRLVGPDERETLLWEGQFSVVPRREAERPDAVFLLHSQVARPQGELAHVLEGDPYSFQLLVARSASPWIVTR